MDYVPALNKARRAFLDTIEPVCTETDALDMALRHYEEALAENGYVVVPLRPTEAMLLAPRSLFISAHQLWADMIAARPTDTATDKG